MIRYWITNDYSPALLQILESCHKTQQLVTYITTSSPENLLSLISSTTPTAATAAPTAPTAATTTTTTTTNASTISLYDLINYEYVTDLNQLLRINLSQVVIVEGLSGMIDGSSGDSDVLSYKIVEFFKKLKVKDKEKEKEEQEQDPLRGEQEERGGKSNERDCWIIDHRRFFFLGSIV
ncbi:predicted protein [Lodderomyces elongisporus NRRL YB-4239]|uniref:Uncharacterized protein n=1 Tax=Lodderomyces elongisporus (strain ATCC 11503 / CBS 2605 / JCM 1781 / NBRC 1676 / NRRL YB-4239) TaxID=379508 RepID=A5DVS4_LODEL|nr:predicted protein [Lodderomyces elongisporus NRRL YB-4239]